MAKRLFPVKVDTLQFSLAFPTATVLSLLRYLQVTATGATLVGQPTVVNGSIVSGAQITCPLASTAHHEVAVSNDGKNFSPKYLFLAYDPSCVTCDDEKPTCIRSVSWTVCSKTSGTVELGVLNS